MEFAEQAEKLKKQHDELHTQYTTPERTMAVCEVCGVFINSTDNDQRKAVGLACNATSLKADHGNCGCYLMQPK